MRLEKWTVSAAKMLKYCREVHEKKSSRYEWLILRVKYAAGIGGIPASRDGVVFNSAILKGIVLATAAVISSGGLIDWMPKND